VLGDLRHAEHGHDAVADELHDLAAVGLDDVTHLRVVAVHQTPHPLGVHALLQASRPLKIGEDDRHRLARLAAAPLGGGRARSRGVDDGRPAGVAEPPGLGQLLITRRATADVSFPAGRAEPRPVSVRRTAGRARDPHRVRPPSDSPEALQPPQAGTLYAAHWSASESPPRRDLRTNVAEPLTTPIVL
jgi:hypothetical protein